MSASKSACRPHMGVLDRAGNEVSGHPRATAGEERPVWMLIWVGTQHVSAASSEGQPLQGLSRIADVPF